MSAIHEENEDTHVFKFVLLGDAAVGKTSFARRIVKKRFRPKYHKTIGVDISHINHKLRDGTRVVITLWDLSGDEQFSSLRSLFFSGTTGVLMVIDVTRELNYESLSSWFLDMDINMASRINIALIANKIDLEEERQISPEFIEGTSLILADQVSSRSIRTFETSAKTGKGCIEAFEWLIMESIEQVKEEKEFKSKVFSPQNIPAILFKLTEIGPDAVYRDFNTLPGVEDVESTLLNMGVALSTAIGQGHTYNEGVFDLPSSVLDGSRLLVCSFRLYDPDTRDERLTYGFFIYVLIIPQKYAKYYEPFSQIEDYLLPTFKALGNAREINEEKLSRIKLEVLQEFEEMFEFRE